MKSAWIAGLAALATVTLAGCANGIEYWDHGEWLDRVSVRPANPVPHTPQQQEQLHAEAARLRTQGEAIRVQMASEKSRDRRMAQLDELQNIGDELRLVEKAAQGARLPKPAALAPQPGGA